MQLVKSVELAIWEEYKSYKEVLIYILKWYAGEVDNWGNVQYENFQIAYKPSNDIDLFQTLHNMNGEDLLKVAIDLGVDTPDFIPSIPTFKNELKSSYKTAFDTFDKAFKYIETDPSLAIGLANSALESIIKEILKDECFSVKLKGGETLYKLASVILKEFKISGENHPGEIKTIANSLLSASQAIETLRSEKTNFHGKTTDDLLIQEPIYAYFVLNAVATVGVFLNSYYKTKYPKAVEFIYPDDDDLPF